MIQWIALAVAVDAHNKSTSAINDSNQISGDSTLVILRPVDLIRVPNGEPTWNFLGFIPLVPKKTVIGTKFWKTISIKKGHIININEYLDDDENKYCALQISEHANIRRSGYDYPITKLLIPESIEKVTRSLEGL